MRCLAQRRLNSLYLTTLCSQRDGNNGAYVLVLSKYRCEWEADALVFEADESFKKVGCRSRWETQPDCTGVGRIPTAPNPRSAVRLVAVYRPGLGDPQLTGSAGPALFAAVAVSMMRHA